MNRIYQLYQNAFGGLSRPAWMLALVMLINRSGTMVVPFLSVYLTGALHFSIGQAGVILSCFGIGSMIGSFAGGYLSDRFGHFIVQFLSLTLGGTIFIILSTVKSFYPLAAGIMVLSIVSESLRPANSASVAGYARPENIARAFSLNRMAVNLGFSIGPALGGFLAAVSYRWLFITDGLTCIAAGLFFFFYFRRRKGTALQGKKGPGTKTGYRAVVANWRFVIFIVLVSCFAILFFQLFMSLPLYYREIYHLKENTIGWLLAINGMVVFSCEMVTVYILNRRFRIHELLFTGMLLVGLSFALLNLMHHFYLLILSMLILSIAEIFSMPFLATFTVQLSDAQNRGSYMGLYTLSFSLANTASPVLCALVISNFGFNVLWWGTGITSVLIGFGFLRITKSG